MRRILALLLVVSSSIAHAVRDYGVPEPGSLADRAYAALLGLAYGDALGALTETYTSDQIRRVMGRRRSLTEPLPMRRILQIRGLENYRRLRIPGYVTDDTQQAMALILLVLSNPEVYTRGSYEIWEGLLAFADLLRAGDDARAWRGQGSSFKAAVDRLHRMYRLERVAARFQPGSVRDHLELLWRRLRGRPHGPDDIYLPSLAGEFSDSNGAAMRTGPLGAMVNEKFSEEFLEAVVITSGLVTHADVRAVAMSYAMFKAVRMLVQGVAVEQVRAELPSHVSRIESRLLAMTDWPKREVDPHAGSRTLGEVFHRLGRMTSPEQVSQLVERYGRPIDHRPNKRRHPMTASSSAATLSVTHALALALGDHATPTEVVEYAVNFGDDSDTVAAMAGSLLGARFGLYWIEHRELPDGPRLWAYAKASIYAQPPESVDEYVAREAALTASETKFQANLPADPPAAACVRLLDDGTYGDAPLEEHRDYLD